MNMLLAFAPFIAFVVIERAVGTSAGLVAAAFVAAVLLARDLVSRERRVKILEVGTFALFGALAAYALIADPSWSVAAVRLRVDTGLLLIVLASIALRQPFTLQYAREQVSRELWSTPAFVRTNYRITFAWALAFAAMVAADLLMVTMPTLPHIAGILITVAALYSAIKFTGQCTQQPQP